MLTRRAIALQGFDFTVDHKPGKLHVVPDTLPRLFGNVSEDTTVKTSSVSDVLQSQPKLVSVVMYLMMGYRATHHHLVHMKYTLVI